MVVGPSHTDQKTPVLRPENMHFLSRPRCSHLLTLVLLEHQCICRAAIVIGCALISSVSSVQKCLVVYISFYSQRAR